MVRWNNTSLFNWKDFFRRDIGSCECFSRKQWVNENVSVGRWLLLISLYSSAVDTFLIFLILMSVFHVYFISFFILLTLIYFICFVWVLSSGSQRKTGGLFSLPIWLWGSNSGHHALQQTPLPLSHLVGPKSRSLKMLKIESRTSYTHTRQALRHWAIASPASSSSSISNETWSHHSQGWPGVH